MNSDAPRRRREIDDETEEAARLAAAAGSTTSVDQGSSVSTGGNPADRLFDEQRDLDAGLVDLHARLDEVLELLGAESSPSPADAKEASARFGANAENTECVGDDQDEIARSAVEGLRQVDHKQADVEAEPPVLRRRGPLSGTLGKLGARLKPLLATTSEDAGPQQEEIAAGTPETAESSPAVVRLAARVVELTRAVEASSHSGDGASLHDDRIETILRRLDTLVEQSAAAEQLDKIRSEIVQIRRGVIERDPPELARIEDQVANLSHRLGAAIEADRNRSAVIDPEEWVARMAAGSEPTMPSAAGMAFQSAPGRLRPVLQSMSDRLRAVYKRAREGAPLPTESQRAGQNPGIRVVGSTIGTPVAVGCPQKATVLRIDEAERHSAASSPQVKPKSELAALRDLVNSPETKAVTIAAAGRLTSVAAESRPSVGQTVRRRRTILATGVAVAIVAALARMFGDADPPKAVASPESAGSVTATTHHESLKTEPQAPSRPQTVGNGTVSRGGPVTLLAFASPEPFESRFGRTSPALPTRGFLKRRHPAASLPLDPMVGPAALRHAAASGNMQAAIEVAARYAEGQVVARDMEKAAQWYEIAAKEGAASAQYRLASLYQHGRGVAQDRTTAVVWYRRAAEQGVAEAMHNLAVMLNDGDMGAGNHDQAVHWFRAAANHRLRDSQFNLGVIYARGLAEDRDLVESFKWFALAAAEGDPEAVARRDEVAAALSQPDRDAARAAVKRWEPAPELALADAMAVSSEVADETSTGIVAADRSALVVKIQTLLAAQGYQPGPADGLEGPKTREAVRAFQRHVGLSETGAINSDLVAVLADQSG